MQIFAGDGTIGHRYHFLSQSFLSGLIWRYARFLCEIGAQGSNSGIIGKFLLFGPILTALYRHMNSQSYTI